MILSLVPSLIRPIPPEPVCNKSNFVSLFYLYWYFFILLNLFWHTDKNFCFYAEINFWDFVRNDNSNKGTTARLNETRFDPKKKYFHTKIFPYIFHIKPLIFKIFRRGHFPSDFPEIPTSKSRINQFLLFALLFTSIYDLNTNVNSWRHNFIWLYSKI